MTTDTIVIEEVNKTLLLSTIKFLESLNKIISDLPLMMYPGRYIWTTYCPSNKTMVKLAKKLDKTEYYGLTITEGQNHAIDSLVDTITTEMIELIEKYDIVKNYYGDVTPLSSVRFLINKDTGNKPVMWFNGFNKFYSVFLNPSLPIPSRPDIVYPKDSTLTDAIVKFKQLVNC